MPPELTVPATVTLGPKFRPEAVIVLQLKPEDAVQMIAFDAP